MIKSAHDSTNHFHFMKFGFNQIIEQVVGEFNDSFNQIVESNFYKITLICQIMR